MNHHLGKPFTREALLRKVDQHVMSADSDPGPEAASGGAAVLDEARLRQFSELLGEERAAEWLSKLRQEIHSLLAWEVHSLGDGKDLAQLAHRLVSHSGSIGFVELARSCRRLEDACLQSGEVDQALRDVKSACQRVLKHM